jgi:WhiB family transcriptional regulator, redox-sensing transcriptional regulator
MTQAAKTERVYRPPYNGMPMKSPLALDAQQLREARCREDPDLFYSDKLHHQIEAKKICSGCPIRVECLTAAIKTGESWGVWGGRFFGKKSRAKA